jgi:biopolymer transport protein ExbD
MGDPTMGFKTYEKNNLPDFDALKAELARQKVAQANANKGKGLKVIIDAQPLVSWQFVVKALDIVIEVDVKDVTFAAKEEPID